MLHFSETFSQFPSNCAVVTLVCLGDGVRKRQLDDIGPRYYAIGPNER